MNKNENNSHTTAMCRFKSCKNTLSYQEKKAKKLVKNCCDGLDLKFRFVDRVLQSIKDY